MKRLVLATTMAMALALPAMADNSDFLIIGNSDQNVLQRLLGSGDLTETESRFVDRGTAITIAADADPAEMRAAFAAFADGLDATTDDVAVALTGQFVSTVAGTYLLPAGDTDDLTLASALSDGFALDAVYAVLAQYPGRALLVLGEVEIDEALPTGLSEELELRDVPQGVTVAIGAAPDAVRFVHRLADWTGDDVLPIARQEGLSLTGFVPESLPMLEAEAQELPQVEEGADSAALDAADEAAWEKALSADRESAYETYLAAFPDGQFAPEARQRLTTIRSEPFYREKQTEADLALSRDARREIQRDLALLGYDTRGIDGIFGRGTRGAVAEWQTQNGLTASSYLTADQITRLDAQAERRAAELEEEARQRQAELERQDRAFWQETGAQGDEAGFRAYLRRFPDGRFAEVAEDRLAAIEAERRAQAEDRDREIWQQVRATDTIDAYRAYLAERPNGAFAEEARARIGWLEENSGQREALARAEAQEAALGLNPAARRLAEAKLADLGLEPGAVDGRFDEDARRAIRRYQDARRLQVTGYLDQPTVVRLMADAILR